MDDLKKTLLARGIAPKEAVRVVKARFPSFDKTLLSKCSKPEKYGVVLHPDGYEALFVKYPAAQPTQPADLPQQANSEPTAKKHKSGGHRLKCRISCRLEDDEYEQLQRLVRSDGFDTMQDWLTHQVRQCIADFEQRRDAICQEEKITKSAVNPESTD